MVFITINLCNIMFDIKCNNIYNYLRREKGIMKIFVSCSSQDTVSDKFKEETKLIAEEISKDDDNELVFGCSNNGLMGIVYRTFLKNKRVITGICYTMYEDLLNDLTMDRVTMVDTLDESNKELINTSDVLLFLPGAYGTFSELITALELKRTNVHNKKIIIYNMDGFYDSLIKQIDLAYKSGCALVNYDEICTVVNNIDELKKELKGSDK